MLGPRAMRVSRNGAGADDRELRGMKFWIRLVICAGPAVFASTVAFAQMAPPGNAPGASQSQGPFELVDPKVFRVCADPHNLPY